MAHGDRARIQPADHARSLFRVELLFSRSSTRGIGQKMHLRSYATFTTFQFFHLLSIFICLFFPPSPLRNFHVTAILRVIEGRKKIRGEIDRILGKELERKLEGQGCFTFPLFHGVTQFQACVDIALSDCIWMELRQRNWASRSTPVAYAFDQISDCLDSVSALLGGKKSCNGIRHEIHRAVNLPPSSPPLPSLRNRKARKRRRALYRSVFQPCARFLRMKSFCRVGRSQPM